MTRFMAACVAATVAALHLSAVAAQHPLANALRAQTRFTSPGLSTQSTDTSGNWIPQSSGTTKPLWSVKALTSLEAWACGDSGVVLRTVDGGATWKNVGGGKIGIETVCNIEALDSSTAFVTTSHSANTYVFRTADGGCSWDTVYSLADGFMDAIHMFDSQKGIAIGDPVGGKWVILRTCDGGATWHRSQSEPAQSGGEYGYVNCLASAGDSQLVFGTSIGTVYHSTDRGATWASARTSQPFVTAVGFLESGIGIATGWDVRWLFPGDWYSRTSDGGATWEQVVGGFGSFINPVAGAGKSDFWGSFGEFIGRSTDAGLTWHPEYHLPLPQTIYTFLALSIATLHGEAFGWAVSGGGFIYKLNGSTLTDVQLPPAATPTAITLDQNYPNPFNPSTTIRYGLPTRSHVTLTVFNTLGQRVATLVDDTEDAGLHEVRFDGTGLASGVYFYRLRAGEYVETKRFVLLR